jgi:23S rRNA pseudouridine1911/1915/1917 synthase
VSEPEGTVRLRVPAEAEGKRLDRFLCASLGGPTRAALRRWILEGRIRIEGRAASKPGLALRSGMELVVEVPRPAAPTLAPDPGVPFEILHRDEHLVVVDKPAGVVVHPGAGVRDGTLVHGLLGRGVGLAPSGSPHRPGIVHRLDRGTSGLLVVARTDAAYAGLVRAFAERSVDKRYAALVWGHPDPDAGTIERAIGRSRSDPTRMSVGLTRGTRRPAITHYRTVERLVGFSRLVLRIETGRTHQIRVHLQSLHHPVVGDDRYGGRPWRGVQDPRKRSALRTFDRLALHAGELAFAHPIDGRALRFTSPLPVAFERLLAVLRAEP